MKTKIIAGMVAALLLVSMLTMTAYYMSQARATTTIISYAPIELYQDTTLQNDYKFIDCDGFIVKRLEGVLIDLNGHKIIGSRTYDTRGILVNSSEYTGEGNVIIRNGEIEGFHAAIFVTRYGWLSHDNWVYIEYIKTKGNGVCLNFEYSWARIKDCSFEEMLACWLSTVFIDSDTKVATGA